MEKKKLSEEMLKTILVYIEQYNIRIVILIN